MDEDATAGWSSADTDQTLGATIDRLLAKARGTGSGDPAALGHTPSKRRAEQKFGNTTTGETHQTAWDALHDVVTLLLTD